MVVHDGGHERAPLARLADAGHARFFPVTILKLLLRPVGILPPEITGFPDLSLAIPGVPSEYLRKMRFLAL
jgi:hypothetical protein